MKLIFDIPVRTCLTLICLTLIWLPLGCSPPETDRIDIIRALSDTGDEACFETVTAPRALVFPADAGPHTGFRTEWWYYTGNLFTETGRHFGYQLTFFRQALSCGPGSGPSAWRTNQLYFAHFAVTDTRNSAFYSGLRMNRESVGIAGAASQPFRVWIDDWRAADSDGGLLLTAREKQTRIRFILDPVKPPVLQGDRGFSRKGRGAGNASFYYSLPRMATRGEISLAGERFRVSGHTWFDHEWSTTALSRDVRGWDWFSAHLDDGRDLMVCRIRQADGRANGFGFGSISFPDGRYQILTESDFRLMPQDRWTSPETGNQYPSGWTLTLPGQDLTLSVIPVIPNQEHAHEFAYWEGAARFTGPGVTGFGYVELTGYEQ